MNDRARITITDLLFYLLAIAALAGLYPVYNAQLELHAASLEQGTYMLFRSVLPLAIIVLLGTLYAKAGLGPE